MKSIHETISDNTGIHKDTPVVSISHLQKSFGSNHVLNDFSMQVYPGESVAVLGKSGSGKSVLIKCMVGLLDPDAGRIEIFGSNIPDLKHMELDKLRARIGFLFQSNALYDSMTVRENLTFPLRRHWIQSTPSEEDKLVREALASVGLEHTIDMLPIELSGGMRKRVALARTLILKPDIILYDEPTTGLDPITGREISRLMVDIQQTYHTTSLVISHDMQCIRITANRIVVLIEGRCYAEGTYQELRQSADPKVKQFFE